MPTWKANRRPAGAGPRAASRQVPGLRPPPWRRPPARGGPVLDPTAPSRRDGPPFWLNGDARQRAAEPPPPRTGARRGTGLGLGPGIGPGAGRGATAAARPLTFISPVGLVRPMTRTHVRLLGPCFKTGRVGHRSFARREGAPGGSPHHSECRSLTARASSSDRRRAARTPGVSPAAAVETAAGYQSLPGLRRPQQRVAATYYQAKYARRRRRGAGHASGWFQGSRLTARPSPRPRAESPRPRPSRSHPFGS